MLEERKLQKAKINLMREGKFALWSGIMMVGRTTVSDTVPTACTNGRDEAYGRKFVAELRETELNFVVLHESMHKAFRHLTTWKKLYDEDSDLANKACDYVINLKLKDIDFYEKHISMPLIRDGAMRGKPMGLIDERFRGMSAKQVFDILKDEKKGRGDGDKNGDGAGGEGQGFDEHDWEGAKEMSEPEKEQLAKDIDQALREGVMNQKKLAGRGAGDVDKDILDLLESKVDWREALREFVKSTCSAKDASSWRRINRRYLSQGIYMPSLIGERVGHLVVGADASGSVFDALEGILSEVKGIAEEVKPEKVDLLYWDSRVAAHEEYGTNDVSNIINSTKPRGGGGTAPSCVSAYLKEKNIQPECVIMITDGHVGGDWGSDWTAPVLWAIVGGNDVIAPNGKTIHVKD